MKLAVALALAGATLAAALAPVTVQPDGRSPAPWRTLDGKTQQRFDLGHAVFNTSWVPDGPEPNRLDGLGPHFNSISCDACHNSRRRGRGPAGDGPAPSDFVMQVGRLRADGTVERGHPRFGHVANSDAIEGFLPEARVTIRYQTVERPRADGSRLTLWRPQYSIETPDGRPLPADLVLMPRASAQAQGAGLLDAIPEQAILTGARPRPGKPQGRPAWIGEGDGRRLGRFGWQATEPSLAHQIAVAFAREMGLGNALIGAIDCAPHDQACLDAGSTVEPEVDPELFAAVLTFQQLESVRRTPEAAARLRGARDGARLFARTGCADCHTPSMPARGAGRIAPYTDLLLHDLGPELADRNLAGDPVPSLWRTAPLWGLSTAHEGGRPVRLLHDGRARSVEEAIGWHGGSAAPARARFDALDAAQRQRLLDWVSAL